MADADAPGLSVWITGKEAISSRNDILGHCELASLDVYGYYLALVAFFYLRAHHSLIDVVAEPCMFFLAITRLPSRHNCFS
jgi:hypothetical protein